MNPPIPFSPHPMYKERLQWLDIAKGIGITLVVYGHLQGDPPGRNLVYCFHMPLFFVLSGYCFSQNVDFPSFCKKKFLRLLVPYCSYSLINYCFYSMWSILFLHKNIISVDSLLQIIPLWTTGSNAGLWFLISLFTVLVAMGYFISSMKNSTYILFSFAIITSIAGFYFSQKFRLPFFLDSSMSAFIFVAFGFGLKLLNTKAIQQKKGICLLTAFLMGIILFLSSQAIHGIDMRGNHYNCSWPVFLIAAFSGTLSCFLFSIAISGNNIIAKLFAFLGTYTLPILGFHFAIFEFTRPIVKIITNNSMGIDNHLLVTALTLSGSILALKLTVLLLNRVKLSHYLWILGI